MMKGREWKPILLYCNTNFVFFFLAVACHPPQLVPAIVCGLCQMACQFLLIKVVSFPLVMYVSTMRCVSYLKVIT